MCRSRYKSLFPFVIASAGIFSFLTSLFLLQLFFGLLFILWLFESNSEKKKAFDTVTIFMLLFIAARLLSIFLSPYPDQSYQALYKDILFYTVFFSMSFYFRVFTKEELYKIILFLAASAVLVAFIGIVRFNFGVVHRAESFGSGYATYSTYLLSALGIILSLNKYFFSDKKYLFTIVIAVILTGIITSLGRFNIALSILILTAGIILFRINYKIILPALLLTSILCFFSFSNNSTEAGQRIGGVSQLSDRDIIYQGAFAIWDQRPLLGFGPRTFQVIFPFPERFGDKFIGSWHNDFLQVYFESGFLGLITFCALLFFILYKGINFILTNKPENGYILYGILLAVAGLILSSLTAGFINSPVLSVYFALLAAFYPAFILKCEQESKQGRTLWKIK